MPLRTKLVAASLPVLLALSSALAPSSVDEGERSSPTEVLSGLTWLAGDWSGDMWGGEFHAYYTTPEGGKLISHSRLMHAGEESFYEFEVFEAHEQTVRLQPFPGGKKASSFLLKSHDPKSRRAVFENPENDFPTEIVYHRVADDNLVIKLSDKVHGSDKVQVFDLKRAADK